MKVPEGFLPMKVPEGFLPEAVQPVRADVARDVLSVLFKWKWMIIGVFLAVVLPVTISTLSKPPKFLAIASTIVKHDRTYLTISPGEESRSVNFPSRNVINSELRIIKSREVVERAVKELESELVGREKPWSNITEAVLAIQDRLDLSPVPDANVIEISYEDGDPALAVKIVNKIAETYQGRHAEINRPKAAHEFFERQASTYLEKLREAERRLTEYQQEQGIVNFDTELKDTRGLINRLQIGAQTTAVEIREERTRLDYLKEEIKTHPRRITMQEETVPNRAVEQLRMRLLQLEQEKKSLLQLYTEKDRRVIGKQEEIDGVRRDLAAEETYVAGRTSSNLNPIHGALEQQLVQGQAKLMSLLAKQRTINQQLSAAQARLGHIGKASSKFFELNKMVDLSQRNVALFNRRSEESRIADLMDREKLLNVAILERAALPLEPINRKTQVTLLMAALAGLVLGVGVAFGVEYFNSSVQSEKMLEQHLDLPVLVTIEQFPR